MPCNPVSVSYAVVTRGEMEGMEERGGKSREGRGRDCMKKRMLVRDRDEERERAKARGR